LNNKQQQIACDFFVRLVLSKFHTKFCLFYKNTSQTHVSLSRRTFFVCSVVMFTVYEGKYSNVDRFVPELFERMDKVVDDLTDKLELCLS